MVAGIETEANLTQRLQAIEHDRIELLQQAVEVLRGIQSGNQAMLTEALAGVVGFAYLLGVQLGIPAHRIDHEVITAFREVLGEENPRARDIDEVVRHLKTRV